MNNYEIELRNALAAHPTLLNENTAQWITSLSTCTRLSIRITALITEILTECARYSTSASIRISRRAIISAMLTARKYHLTPDKAIQDIDEKQFEKSLERCTHLGIYLVHSTFTLTELFAMSSFHFFSSTLKSGLWLAEESVRIFDGFFGSTETSRALASIVLLIKKEMYEDNDFMNGHIKSRSLIAALTKSLTAFACLQNITHQRLSREKYLIELCQGQIPLSILFKKEKKPKLLTGGMVKSNSEPGFLLKDTSKQSLTPLTETKMSYLPFPKLKDPVTERVKRTGGPSIRARRSKSFSCISRKLNSFQTTDFSFGMVELLDQSNDISFSFEDSHQQSHIGEKAILESGVRPKFFEPNLALFKKLKDQIKMNQNLTDSSPLKESVCSDQFLPNPANLLSLIHRFMRYSSAAYGSHFMRILGIGAFEEDQPNELNISKDTHINHHAFAKHTSTPLESILFSSFSSVSSAFQSSKSYFLTPTTIHPLVHYVTVDHGVKAIVLTCRGTLGISDALTDLTCDYVPIILGGKRYKAHKGMYRSALEMSRSTSELHSILTKALNDYPNYGLVLCGHSLGGGVVSLLAALWSEVDSESSERRFRTSESSKLPVGRYLHCFTYGVPPTLSFEGSEYCTGLVTSLVNQHDIVPCLSLGILRDFKNVTTNLMQEHDLPQLILQRILGFPTKEIPSNSKEVMAQENLDDWFWSLIKTMRADMQSEKLYPPGDIYILNHKTIDSNHSKVNQKDPTLPTRSNTFPSSNYQSNTNTDTSNSFSNGSDSKVLQITFSQCKNRKELFSEIIFSKSMFSDHSPRSYEDNMDALAKSLNL